MVGGEQTDETAFFKLGVVEIWREMCHPTAVSAQCLQRDSQEDDRCLTTLNPVQCCSPLYFYMNSRASERGVGSNSV